MTFFISTSFATAVPIPHQGRCHCGRAVSHSNVPCSYSISQGCSWVHITAGKAASGHGQRTLHRCAIPCIRLSAMYSRLSCEKDVRQGHQVGGRRTVHLQGSRCKVRLSRFCRGSSNFAVLGEKKDCFSVLPVDIVVYCSSPAIPEKKISRNQMPLGDFDSIIVAQVATTLGVFDDTKIYCDGSGRSEALRCLSELPTPSQGRA